ncbi:MAG: Eco57I restriction-modification methylase domain-containing protein, partial [Deltaproteobacteria bacterium]|nr:Eco57I restriction-modification methylase domain-containing protein [Deltaproteobacteria bacterium]
KISNISVLDPACGSGSFLISAFGKLMEYHLEYLMKHRKEAEQGRLFPDLVQDERGEWKLSIEKKRNILFNNIFGVDIDSQAIGICIMSLYLKALEGEQRLPTRRSLLPTLDNNIQCGNSLVSGTTEDLQNLIGEHYQERQPFNWEVHFPQIFIEKGGFDIVVMNPPYVKIQKMMEDTVNDVKFLQEKYKTAQDGSCDIYVAFIEKSISLLNSDGRLGLICPHKFFQSKYGVELRKTLTTSGHLKEIVSFGDIQIFEGASTYTCLLYCSKKKTNSVKFTKVKDEKFLDAGLQLSLECKTEYEDNGVVVDFYKNEELSATDEWHFVAGKERKPFEKLSIAATFLEDLSEDIYQGVISGADDVFILDGKINPKKDIQILTSRELGEQIRIETAVLKPILQGFTDVKPFLVNQPTAHIIFPYFQADGRARLIPLSKLRRDYPLALEYFKKNKARLEAREGGRWAGNEFYCFSRNQNLFKFCGEKIMLPYMVNKLTAYHDRSSHYYFVNVTTGGYSITLKENSPITYGYLSGLLNSSILNFYIKKVGSNFRGGFFPCSTQFLKKLPIVIPETQDQKNIAKKIEELMNTINSKISNGNALAESEIFENQKQLDQLVSTLYDVDQFLEILKAS